MEFPPQKILLEFHPKIIQAQIRFGWFIYQDSFIRVKVRGSKSFSRYGPHKSMPTRFDHPELLSHITIMYTKTNFLIVCTRTFVFLKLKRVKAFFFLR